MFKRSRYFSLISLIAFIIVTVLLGQLYHQAIVKELIKLGENKNVALTQAFAKTERKVFGGIIAILALLYVALFLIVNKTHFSAVKKDITEHKRAEAALYESQQQIEASYQREQKRRQLSDTLREIAKIVSSSLEQEEVLDLILAQLEHVITYHRATVSLLEGRTLTLVAGRDKMGGTIKPYSFPGDAYPINAQVLTSKQPVLVPDVIRDQRWHQTTTMQGIRSFISAPLLVQEQPIGILAVGKLGDVPYTVEDTQTVFAFATQVAIAVRNAQLHAEAQQRNQRLVLLHDISLAVNSILDLPTILTAASRKLVEHFHADHSGTLLFDDDWSYGEVMAEFPSQNAVGIRISLGDYALVQEMLKTGQPQAVYDAQHDPLTEKVWEVMRSLGIRSILIVPLIIKGRIIGSYSLDITSTQRRFESSEIELAQTVASQLSIAIDNARLLERERARIEQELQTARQIQKSLLPLDMPEIPGLDIAGFSQPAREIGGDFYHFSVFDPQHLGIAVGDVSGKGLKAALMMTLSFGLLTTEVHRTTTPAALMTILNTALRPHTQHNKMNTALGYMTLTPHNKNAEQWYLRVANAGMIAPLIRHRDGTVEWLDVAGLPLGTMEGIEYTESHQTLVAGDLVFLTSDGVIEAMDASGEMYGFDRLAASVAAANCQTAQTMLEYVLTEVRDFMGKTDMHDDLTMVAIMVETNTRVD